MTIETLLYQPLRFIMMTFTSERVKIVYLQEVQVFRVFVPWEEERGLSEPRPQVLCFITKFGKNEFISSDAMSKLRQVIKFDFAWDKWTVGFICFSHTYM